MNALEKIKGTVKYIIHPKMFFRQPFEYAVIQVIVNKKRKIVKGEMMACKPGDILEFTGEWINDQSGESFVVTHVSRVDTGEEGALSYLQACFGEKTGILIADYYGSAEHALYQFRLDPHELTRAGIKRVGCATVEKAIIKHQKYKVVDDLLQLLQPHGLSVEQVFLLYKQYAEHTLSVIRNNPFAPLFETQWFSFESCEKIASAFSVSHNDERRLEAGVKHVLMMAMQEGHCYLPAELLADKAHQMLSKDQIISKLYIQQAMIKACREERLILEKGDCVYLPEIYESEKFVAKFVNANQRILAFQEDHIRFQIKAFENEKNIQLAPEQREAVFKAVRHQFSIITGPPGSGKTTILNAIIYVIEKLHAIVPRFGLAAPTGRASQRMTEAAGIQAVTLHKLLEYRPADGGRWVFAHTEENPLPYDVIIVDEISMLDIPLAAALVRAIPPNANIILLGDKNQLSPVGVGNFLLDMLEANRYVVTHLTKTHRFGGVLLERANQVNDGIQPDLTDTSDFRFIEDDDESELITHAIKEYQLGVLQYGISDTMFITPMHDGSFGRIQMNKLLQEHINPKHPTKKELYYRYQLFREGDRVAQITNDPSRGVTNGQIGNLLCIQFADAELDLPEGMLVDFDGERIWYFRDTYHQLQLGFAITCHKAQGCEAKKVILPFSKEHEFMLRRNLVYTAMTRVKKELICIGSKEMFRKAVIDPYFKPRYSLLKDRLNARI